jgi:hypothetical protein
MIRPKRVCPVQSYMHPFVYLNVRDYMNVDIDGVIGIQLDELVLECFKESIEENENANGKS